MPYTFSLFFKLFPLFFATLFISTWGILGGYFEQDEWGALAGVMRNYNLPWWDIFISRGIHFAPLAISFWTLLYETFGLQAHYYHLIQLIVHAANTTLVFILTLQLTKKWPIAAITALLFLLNSRAHQAFTHLSLLNSTDMAMFFILSFFIYLFNVKNKLLGIKDVLILLGLFIFAASFREEAFIIIPVFVIYFFTFGKSKLIRSNFKPVLLFTSGIIIFLFLRLYSHSLNYQSVALNQQVTSGVGLEYNLATIPIKFLVQNLIWSERIALFFVENTPKLYPDIEHFFTSHAPIMDASFFYLFGGLMIIVVLWLWKNKISDFTSLALFALSWIFANSVMLSFVGRHISVVEPRYLYYSSFPIFLLVSFILYSLFFSKSKVFLHRLFLKIFVLLSLFLLLFTSLKEIRIAVDRTIIHGETKKMTLQNLTKAHPELGKNTILFIKCKEECYRNAELGIPAENVLPFSSGPGMNLLVYYAALQSQEKEWGPFFTDFFLFHTLSEDYKKVGDRSFGYFVTQSKLEKTLRDNNLSRDIIVALEYNGDNYSFRDISEEFRQILSVDR